MEKIKPSMVFQPDHYRVIVKDGIQQLTYKGEILPHQIESVITQGMEHIKDRKCRAQITVFAYLDDTIENNIS